MNKKKFLTESDRKKIVSDKEKAILESFAKTFNKIKRIDENEVAGIETKQLEKKAFDFANSPEMGQLVDKILANAKPEDLQQIKNAVGSVSEGMMCENDFSSFLNIAHKAQSALSEDNSVGSLQNSVGKALSTFGVVNIMSMGMLPSLVGMAVDHFGGTNFLQSFSDAVGSGGAAAGLSVIGSLIGGGLLWRLGKAISGEKVTGDTPLFEMNMNEGKTILKSTDKDDLKADIAKEKKKHPNAKVGLITKNGKIFSVEITHNNVNEGEDYEKIGREVEYGINPYEEESNVSFEPMNNDEKKMLSYVSKYVGSELELSDEMDNYRNLGYQGFSDNVKNALRNDMDYQTWVQMSHDEDTFRRERGF